jgi:hypothetical protein
VAAGGGAEEQQHKGDKDEAEGGTKRTLTYLWKLLTARGHDVLKIQDDIKTLIVKSLVCAEEEMEHSCNSFEVRSPRTVVCAEEEMEHSCNSFEVRSPS